MADRLQLRRDTAAQWEAVNPILRLCEIGLVIDGAGQVTGMKIGDGRVWKALPLIPIAEKVSASMIADGAVTSEKIAKGVLPTKVSQLTNDSGYLTEAFAENHILNSRFANNAEKWEGDGYEEVENVHYRSVSGVRVTGEIVQNVDVEEGVYTLSFRYSSESTTPNYVYIDGDVDNITSNFSSEDSPDLELPNTVNLSGNYITITFNAYGGDIAVGFYTDEGSFTLSEVKLEKGKKASSFSLNTRDVADVYEGSGNPILNSDNLILNADFSLLAPDSTPIGWTLTATPDKYIFGRGYVTIKDGRSLTQTVNLEVGKRYMLKLNVSSMNIGDYPNIFMTIKNATDIYVDGTSKTSTSFAIDFNKQPVDEHTIVFTANGSTEITFEGDNDGWSSSPSISGISLVCAGEGTEVC